MVRAGAGSDGDRRFSTADEDTAAAEAEMNAGTTSVGDQTQKYAVGGVSVGDELAKLNPEKVSMSAHQRKTKPRLRKVGYVHYRCAWCFCPLPPEESPPFLRQP